MMTWTDEQIDQWCLALQAYREDNLAKTEAAELRRLRHHQGVTVFHSALTQEKCNIDLLT